MAFAVVVSSSGIVDVIPHYNNYGYNYGNGVSARYFRKAQDLGYYGRNYFGYGYGNGYGYAPYGYGYSPYGYGYAPIGYGYGLGYGLGYGGHIYGKW